MTEDNQTTPPARPVDEVTEPAPIGEFFVKRPARDIAEELKNIMLQCFDKKKVNQLFENEEVAEKLGSNAGALLNYLCLEEWSESRAGTQLRNPANLAHEKNPRSGFLNSTYYYPETISAWKIKDGKEEKAHSNFESLVTSLSQTQEFPEGFGVRNRGHNSR